PTPSKTTTIPDAGRSSVSTVPTSPGFTWAAFPASGSGPTHSTAWPGRNHGSYRSSCTRQRYRVAAAAAHPAAKVDLTPSDVLATIPQRNDVDESRNQD